MAMDMEGRDTWAMLPMHLTTMMYAKSMLGAHEDYEKGSWTNWGPEVKEFLFAAGLDKPAPWCAAFVNWCAEKAAADHNRTSPLEDVRLQAYVQSYADWAKVNDLFIPAEDTGPGDLFVLYYPSLERFAHIGFTEEVNEQEGWYTTIEGNTNDDAVREGYEVATRRRNLTARTKFIRWN